MPDADASVIPLHQAPRQTDKTGAARAKAYRERRKLEKLGAGDVKRPAQPSLPEERSSEAAGPAVGVTPTVTQSVTTVTHIPVTLRHAPVTPQTVTILPPVTPSRYSVASVILTAAALTLGAVGIAINGWFARSLGATDLAGWIFLAVGVAADAAALILPPCAAGLWQARQRTTAAVAWAVWLVSFVFAVTAGVGFASTNISDVTLSRASRVTPAVTAAQAALADAVTARYRECKGGVGKFCREREAAVAERRQVLDAAMAPVEQAADPQTQAALKLVAWASGGTLRPALEDFAILRLMLLALLPQIGGISMMVGRRTLAQA